VSCRSRGVWKGEAVESGNGKLGRTLIVERCFMIRRTFVLGVREIS
jgi:hypothetical protein